MDKWKALNLLWRLWDVTVMTKNNIHYEMHHQFAVINALFIPVNGEVEWISLRNTPKLL